MPTHPQPRTHLKLARVKRQRHDQRTPQPIKTQNQPHRPPMSSNRLKRHESKRFVDILTLPHQPHRFRFRPGVFVWYSSEHHVGGERQYRCGRPERNHHAEQTASLPVESGGQPTAAWVRRLARRPRLAIRTSVETHCAIVSSRVVRRVELIVNLDQNLHRVAAGVDRPILWRRTNLISRRYRRAVIPNGGGAESGNAT